MITIALAKGRITDDVIPLFTKAGLPMPRNLDESRALVFEESSTQYGTIRYLLAKPVDVPTYVTYGVADLGVVGKDILLEQEKELYELLNLRVAECRLCVAGLPDQKAHRPERIATKYPRLTDQYFRGLGQAVEIVTLSGSIELASVIGLTDRIFDLVQTGSTLVANGLEVFDEVHEISARLVANRSSYRVKQSVIRPILDALTVVCEEA